MFTQKDVHNVKSLQNFKKKFAQFIKISQKKRSWANLVLMRTKYKAYPALPLDEESHQQGWLG
jgi:hypothetical protein